MSLKGECVIKIEEITKGKKSGHSPLGMWTFNSKSLDFCMMGNPPIANCVQVNLKTNEDHWIWLAIHPVLFREV